MGHEWAMMVICNHHNNKSNPLTREVLEDLYQELIMLDASIQKYDKKL